METDGKSWNLTADLPSKKISPDQLIYRVVHVVVECGMDYVDIR